LTQILNATRDATRKAATSSHMGLVLLVACAVSMVLLVAVLILRF
jgi:hypothetical protein